MPEGLKLVISADITQAQAATKAIVRDAQVAGKGVEKAFGKSALPLNKGLQDTSRTLKVVTPQVNTLSNSIETLRAKILARKDFLLRETDVAKIKVYNAEIRTLQAEMVKLQTIGSSSLGAVGKAGTKAFSFLRTAANILPGIGIAGLFGVGFDLISGLFNKTSEASEELAKKLKELIRPIAEIREEAAAGTGEELAKVNALANAVLNQTLSYKERNAALNQLKDINKAYFGDLTLETAQLGLLTDRVKEYTKAIIAAAVVKGFESEIGKVAPELAKQNKALNKAAEEARKYNEVLKNTTKTTVSLTEGVKVSQSFIDAAKASQKANDAYNDQIKVAGSLQTQMKDLEGGINEAVLAMLKLKPLDTKDPKAAKAIKDQTDAIIAEAKRVAEFLSKGPFIAQYEFSPLDSKAEALRKAQAFLNSVSTGKLKLVLKTDLTTFSEPPNIGEIISDVKSDIERLDPGGILLPTKLGAPEPFDPSIIRAMQDYVDATEDERLKLIQLAKEANLVATAVNNVLSPAFDGLFSTIQSGEDPIKAFFKGIGQGVIGLIKQLVQAIALAAILSAILPGAQVTKAGGFLGILKGLFGLAGGGLITGPTLAMVGEGSGTSLSNPEVVAPLDQLKQMLTGIGGIQKVHVTVSGRLRGKDQLLQNARTSRSQRRLGAG